MLIGCIDIQCVEGIDGFSIHLVIFCPALVCLGCCSQELDESSTDELIESLAEFQVF